ncbi:hypothetical protein C3L33_06739, partial [Rhododendron williamsianum]
MTAPASADQYFHEGLKIKVSRQTLGLLKQQKIVILLLIHDHCKNHADPDDFFSNLDFSSLNLVQDCNSIVEYEFEKESSRLETKYYADLQHDQFHNEDSDYMNESDTFGNYD